MATMAWLNWMPGMSTSRRTPAVMRTLYASTPMERSRVTRNSALSRHTPYLRWQVCSAGAGMKPAFSPVKAVST